MLISILLHARQVYNRNVIQQRASREGEVARANYKVNSVHVLALDVTHHCMKCNVV